METIVVVAHHRNQCYEKNNRNLGSPTFRDFKELSCRTFQSGGGGGGGGGGVGILPTPIKACTTPDGKRGFGLSPSSPFSKSPFPASFDYFSEDVTNSEGNALKKSSSIPIPIKGESERERSLFSNDFSYSELWAGPAYSNSPPPSSLPIPKFFAPPKRSASLDFPSSSVSDMDLHPLARSAPPSPKREHNVSARKLFHSTDHALATQDLRRILNLDVSDD